MVSGIRNIHPEIKPYVQEYRNVYADVCKEDLIMPDAYNFNITDYASGDYVGVCVFMGGVRNIEFRSDVWEYYDGHNRKMLVFHELSHCLLNKKHVDNTTNYMYPYLTDISDDVLYEQVRKDMYGHCNKGI